VGFFSNAQSPLFKNMDRVCFVGNSITYGGEFHHNIFLYQQTRFPKEFVSFYNCGIPGDVCSGILKRMDDDIFIHKPNVFVLKIGMNDMTGSLFGTEPTNNADTLQKREVAFNLYSKNYEKIVNEAISRGAKVILQAPSIYDQTVKVSRKNQFGKNDALKRCRDFIDSFAHKNNLPFVDYWTILNNINYKLQKNDSTATVIGPDRVHPGTTGNLIMAYKYLKTMDVPKYVSRIIVGKGEKINPKECQNCTLTSLKKSNVGISFKVKEEALPFPTVENQKQGLELVPFIEELNVEELMIKSIPRGNFKLTIDSITIGTFSSEELKKGINLALYRNTPQYLQSLKVRDILTTLWKKESNLREIKFLEYNDEYKKAPNRQNLDSLTNYLTPIFKKYENPYFAKQLEAYKKNKLQEADFINDTELLRKKAYDAAQPVEHTYKIEMVL
jgi:lysophospholipase L1-like esterase